MSEVPRWFSAIKRTLDAKPCACEEGYDEANRGFTCLRCEDLDALERIGELMEEVCTTETKEAGEVVDGVAWRTSGRWYFSDGFAPPWAEPATLTVRTTETENGKA